MRNHTLVVVVCLAVCLVAYGQQAPTVKPDFSGTWELDHERSSIQIHSPDSSTFRIEHKDPHWRLERTHVFGEHSNTLSFELTTDGEPTTFTRNGWEMHARMFWDGETLVLDSTMSREDQKVTNIVRYRLEDDGQTFIAEEHMESEQESHDNLWVFSRSDDTGT